jgi:putative ABC transport system permease protein
MSFRSLVRSLFRDPRSSLSALLMLSLGLGSFAWMVALQRSLSQRSLPVPEPGRLVRLWNGARSQPGVHGTPSTAELKRMRGFPGVFQGVAAFVPKDANLGLDQPVQVKLDRVTPDFFRVLGVSPASGRGFLDSDGEAGAAGTVVLTHDAWRRYFGGASDLLGHRIQLDGRACQVVGVLPRGFHTPHGTEFFTPLQWTAQQSDDPGPHFLRVLGRLKPGASLGQAQAAMDRVTEDSKAFFLQEGASSQEVADLTFGASPAIDEALGDGLRVFHTLQVAALFLLGLATLNASAIFIVRAVARRREMAVRNALGASDLALLRLLLAEGALLGAAGGLGGLFLAWLGLRGAGLAIPWGFPELSLQSLRLDGTTLALALVAGPVLGALCALPARPGRRLLGLLREGGRGQTGADGRLRRILVGGQLALACALLAAAFSLQGTLTRYLNRDLGLRPGNAWTFRVTPRPRMPLAERTMLAESLRLRLLALPGVQSVSLMNNVPMSGFESDFYSVLADGRKLDPQARCATPGLVGALGLRLLRGRDFDSGDTAEAARVILLTRKLAREVFGSEDAVGRSYPFGDGRETATVVGILEDFREFGPAREAPPLFFLPQAQAGLVWNETLHAVVRTGGAPCSLAQVQAIVREVAPTLAVHHFGSLAENLDVVLGPQRMARAFLATFTILALVLAFGGVFALMASAVAGRTLEFGVRSALGATPRDLLVLVLQEAGILGLAGGCAGGLLGALGERLAPDLLGAGALRAASLPLALLGLILMAIAASLPAALKAALTPPMASLRRG